MTCTYFGCKQTWPATILVVSHDREFLNTVATDVLHLHSQRIDTYHGDYDSFVKTKTERLKNQQREYEAQKEYRDHVQVRLSPILLLLLLPRLLLLLLLQIQLQLMMPELKYQIY